MNTGKILVHGALWLSFLISLSLQAWDAIGHRVVGEVAQHHLDEKVKKEVELILGGKDLAQVSTWADEIKSLKEWDHAKPWHYINIPEGKSLQSSTKSPQGDVVEAISRLREVLVNKKAKNQDREEALKFIVHFIGDLHQPLHAGYENDRGGNSVKVKWFKQSTNLHHVWDEELIGQQKLSFTELTRFIDRPPRNKEAREEMEKWQDSPIEEWVEESRKLLPQVYQIGKGKLGYPYFQKNVEIVNKRLWQGGLRLAAFLHSALGGAKGRLHY